MADQPIALPDALQDLLDGTDLVGKVGHTLLLIAGGDDLPRVAMLSVGEVYANAPDQLRMAVYRDSRTTRQTMETGRCLLFFVLSDTVYKIGLSLTDSETFADDPINVYLQAEIIDVAVDVVDYARMTSTLWFELAEPHQALQRWEQTVARLRKMGA